MLMQEALSEYIQYYLSSPIHPDLDKGVISSIEVDELVSEQNIILDHASLIHLLSAFPPFEEIKAAADAEADAEYFDIDDQLYEEEESILNAEVGTMVGLLLSISEDDYNWLIINRVPLIAINHLKTQEGWDEYRLKIEREVASRKDVTANYNLAFFKSTTSEALRPIKLSSDEKGVFGSELLGYRELQAYYESPDGGKIKTYHFGVTDKLLTMSSGSRSIKSSRQA